MKYAVRRGRTVLAILVLCGAGLVAARGAHAEVIRSFDADLRLLRDTTLDVTETIVMDFESAERHGIFRVIPVRYERHNNSYTIDLRLESVTDETGAALDYTTARQGRDLSIRIGDAHRTMTGVHTYRIHYLVRRAVNFFKDAPEAYWNATGDEWPFAMRQVRANFYPPPGTPPDQVRTASYVGVLGSREPGSVEVEEDHIVFSTANLAPGQGLTLVAGLPAGSVTRPGALEELGWLLADWWPLFVFPLAALALVLFQWLRSGRDIDGGQAVAVEWSPPKDLTPAEAGTLVDERCDMGDIVSTLIDLAARGYLRIEETKAEKFLFFSSKDYVFHRLAAADGDLLLHERQFLNGLFQSGDRATLSGLKDKFYTHLPGIRNAIYESLTRKRLFTSNPDTVRKLYRALGLSVLALGVVVAIFGAGLGRIAYGLGMIGAGLIVAVSARAMPAKTAAGSRAFRECLGFQRFVRLAEKDRIQVLAKDDPTIFGRLLPYAVVLGVADQWAEAFRDLIHEPPDWYVPYGSGAPYIFSSNVFVHDLGSGMNTMGRTFASSPAPSSTGGGGGSGFSGGGGAGGGFGGGGGGSW